MSTRAISCVASILARAKRPWPKANLEAEINVNARQLNATRSVSEAAGVQRATSGISSAQAGIEGATAAVAVATREIERLQISAPFAGLPETDTAELGTLMQPGSPCATIVQLNPMKLVGFVPETEVEKVFVGARATAELSSGTQVSGRVTFNLGEQTTTRTPSVSRSRFLTTILRSATGKPSESKWHMRVAKRTDYRSLH